MTYRLSFLFVIFATLTVSCATKDTKTAASLKSPVPAEDALSTFEVAPGFEIQLLAAEPLIASPVDMEIDEYGRLYVVEMPGYPLDKRVTKLCFAGSLLEQPLIRTETD